MYSTRRRSLLKAVTYRVITTILLGLISYFITGSFFEASTITIIFAILATLLYYLNERVWNRVDWGKKPKERRPIEENP